MTTPSTVIVDYRAGNITSVRRAFDRLRAAVLVTAKPEEIATARRIVFPGVGSAAAAMRVLKENKLDAALRLAVSRKVPFFGICLGAQIIFDRSEEDGGVDCLGLLPGTVRRFTPARHEDKVPQIGWNTVICGRSHPLLSGIENESEFYFVHSYYPAPAEPDTVLAETEYAGVRFASILARGNILAAQFHPEKSGRIGLTMLKNFLEWDQ